MVEVYLINGGIDFRYRKRSFSPMISGIGTFELSGDGNWICDIW